MENTHIKQMMLDVRREYEHRLGYVIDDESRLNHYVQDRVALANALRPYATYKSIGELFGKDHSSVVHYIKEHEPMMTCYPSYIAKYKDAVEITNRVSDRMSVLPKTKLGRTRNLHTELKTVRQTIKKLQEFEKKLEAKLVGCEESA